MYVPICTEQKDSKKPCGVGGGRAGTCPVPAHGYGSGMRGVWAWPAFPASAPALGTLVIMLARGTVRWEPNMHAIAMLRGGAYVRLVTRARRQVAGRLCAIDRRFVRTTRWLCPALSWQYKFITLHSGSWALARGIKRTDHDVAVMPRCRARYDGSIHLLLLLAIDLHCPFTLHSYDLSDCTEYNSSSSSTCSPSPNGICSMVSVCSSQE